MKNIFLIIAFISTYNLAFSQCNYAYNFFPDPINNCCYNLLIDVPNSCIAEDHNTVTFSINNNPSIIQTISSATPLSAASFFSTSINTSNDEVTFTSTSTNLAALTVASFEICFEAFDLLTYEVEVSGNTPTDMTSGNIFLSTGCAPDCLLLLNSSVNCTSTYNTYDYSVTVEDLTNLPNNICNFSVGSATTGVIVQANTHTVVWNNFIATINGQLTANPTIVPATIDLKITYSCDDMGMITACELIVPLTLSCCNCSGNIGIASSAMDPCCFDITMMASNCPSSAIYDNLRITIDNSPPIFNTIIPNPFIPNISGTIDPQLPASSIIFETPNFDLQTFTGIVGTVCIQDNPGLTINYTAQLSSSQVVNPPLEVCTETFDWEAPACPQACAQIVNTPTITCNPNTGIGELDFSVDINNVGNITSCTISATSPEGTINLTSNQLSGGLNTVTGSIDLNNTGSFPTNITIDFVIDCIDLNGSMFSCLVDYTFSAPCCDCFDSYLMPSMTSDCCFELMFQMLDFDCTTYGQVNQVDFSLNSTTANIASITQIWPSVFPTQIGNDITFFTPSGFNANTIFLSPRAIGEICFDSPPNDILNYDVDIIQPPNIAYCPIPNNNQMNGNCGCGEIIAGSEMINCGSMPNEYDFSISVEHLFNVPNPGACWIDMTSTNSTISNQSNTAWNNNQTTISGTFSTSGNLPATVDGEITINCVDMTGDTLRCMLPYTFTKPCCDIFEMPDITLCTNNYNVDISIGNCNTSGNVTNVNWYAVPAPCPSLANGFDPNDWGAAVAQISGGNITNCSSTFNPSAYGYLGDVCVIAEVIYNSNGPCQTVYSNVSNVFICPPPCNLAQIVGNPNIICGMGPNEFDFNINIQNQSGFSTCGIDVALVNPVGNISFNPLQTNSGQTTISGNVILNTGTTLPATFDIEITLTCTDANGNMFICTIPYTFTTPCCDCFDVRLFPSSTTACCYDLVLQYDPACQVYGQFDMVNFSIDNFINPATITSIQPVFPWSVNNQNATDIDFMSSQNIFNIPNTSPIGEICIDAPNGIIDYGTKVVDPPGIYTCPLTDNLGAATNCTCGGIVGSPSITCGNSVDIYDIMLTVENTSIHTSNNCWVELTSSNSTLNSIIMTPWSNNQTTISAEATSIGFPPYDIDVLATINCVTSIGDTAICEIPYSFIKPCCDINPSLDDQIICSTKQLAYMSLIDCPNLTNVAMINWYAVDGPCPSLANGFDPNDWGGTPYFQSSGSILSCDAVIDPNDFTGNICVIAEVVFNTGHPCPNLFTKIATVELCQSSSCMVAEIIGTPTLECTNAAHEYIYSFDLQNISNSSSCSVSITSPQGSLLVNTNTLGANNTTFFGSINLIPPLSAGSNVVFEIEVTCTDPSTGYDVICDLSYTYQVPCCDCFDAYLQPSGSHPCCYDLMYQLTNPDCSTLGPIDKLDFDLTNNTTNIDAIFPRIASIQPTLNGNNIEFNSTVDLASSNFLTAQAIGEICFDYVPNAFVNFEVNANSTAGVDICPVNSSIVTDIECECGDFVPKIECGAVIGEYDFDIDFENKSRFNSNDCTLTITSSNATINNLSISNWLNDRSIISGVFDAPGANPNTVNGIITMTCTDNTGMVIETCDFPYVFNKPCCDTIGIVDQMICSTDPSVQVNLMNCANLNNVNQVNWYVTSGPCPSLVNGFDPNDWGGVPYSSSSGSNIQCDLTIDPNQFSGDICVIAEIAFNPGELCNLIYSNVSTISRCEAINCFVNSNQFDYCYMNAPIIPSQLVVGFPTGVPNCAFTMQWHDANGPIPGETGPGYQPPALSLSNGSTACFEDFFYKVVVTDQCGSVEHNATIRLYNDDAHPGDLVLDPLIPTPLCFGDDATIAFTSNCAIPNEWSWCKSNDNINWTDLPGAGTTNPIYNTNKLYQPHYFKAVVKNGTCPADSVSIFIDVMGDLKILSFDAIPMPNDCNATSVELTADFVPCIAGSSCACTIEWYRNGTLIAGPTTSTVPASYNYTGPDLSGNYYAIVEDCCGKRKTTSVVSIPTSWSVIVVGPCFRCNNEPVDLIALLSDVDPNAVCTFQWFEVINGVPTLIPGAINQIYTTLNAGQFVVEATCDGCTKSASFDLMQCGQVVNVNNVLILEEFKIHPNPTNDLLHVEWEHPLIEDMEIEITNLLGQSVLNKTVNQGSELIEINVSSLTAGVYLIQLKNEKNRYRAIQFVKL